MGIKLRFQFYINIIISNLFIIFIIIICFFFYIKFNDNTNIDNQIIYVSNSIYLKKYIYIYIE